LLRSESAATIRNTIAAQNMLPVKNQTTAASNIAGKKTMSNPTTITMITPITIRTNAIKRIFVKLPRTDCRKVRINENS